MEQGQQVQGNYPVEDYYEIDLKEILQLLWTNKWFLAVLFLAAVILAAVVSTYVLEPVYQTEAILLAPDYRLLNQSSLSREDYINFLYKGELGEKIIEELNLREENPGFTVQQLNKKLSVNINEDNQTVKLSYKDGDPVRASRALALWISLFNDELKGYIQENNNKYFSSLESIYLEREAAYLQAQEALTAFKQENNLELATARLENLQNRLVNYESRLDSLKLSLGKQEEEYQKVLSQLQETLPHLTINEVVSEEGKALINKIFTDKTIDGLSVEQETINPQYLNLLGKKHELEQLIASDKKELALITAEVEPLAAEVAELKRELAAQEELQTRLLQELELKKKDYLTAEANYSQAKRDLAKMDYDLSLILEPVVPDRPVAPNKKLNVAIAGVLALMLGVFIVFMREYLREE